ncbi:DUF7373 family lipoprotein [Nocardia sp. CA-107356]|uniref:DUF7373 family lipoprotein n=1 Tax=Nocardia sp. CA-107356 TaxID=3239972 RepID=UPI003D92F448
MKRGQLFQALRAAAALVLVTVLGGCGATVHGTGVASEIDVRTLDVGTLPTSSPKLASRLSNLGYLRLEAARISDAVLSPHVVDAKYSGGASARAHTDAQSVTYYLADAVIPVLQKHGLVVGFSTGSADDSRPLTKAALGTREREGLAVTVLRFSNAADAEAAATELDAVDFGINPENVAVKLPRYASSAAHWRPSVPTLGSTTAHGVFVVSVLADARTTDLNRLIEMTQKYLDAELPELDTFTPSPPDKFNSLRQDPDNLLVRTLHESGVVPEPDGQGEVVYTARGYLNYILDQAGRYPVMQRAGVDRVAMTPSVIVFRTRDDAAAAKFVTESVELDPAVNHRAVDPPDDVPNTSCTQDFSASSTAQFRCFVAYRRYVALLLGGRLWETQQMAAAQYALLANSR